ncbi:HalOD1 output domain-containing protein [Haloprofundus salinisoli]|uniref:HalOD1 output domain-containing protein n=1 Tax=Haloprofundus salinisoli TaxID=2876193 RepID=UPI001CCA0122|nr:HalOD1 output domain-containing protein [Haloprofundus salinisoli]
MGCSQREFRRSQERALVVDVVEAVESVSGFEQSELPPLYETVDMEAVENAVRSGSGVVVGFEYSGHTVTVVDNSRLIVEPLERSE